MFSEDLKQYAVTFDIFSDGKEISEDASWETDSSLTTRKKAIEYAVKQIKENEELFGVEVPQWFAIGEAYLEHVDMKDIQDALDPEYFIDDLSNWFDTDFFENNQRKIEEIFKDVAKVTFDKFKEYQLDTPCFRIDNTEIFNRKDFEEAN